MELACQAVLMLGGELRRLSAAAKDLVRTTQKVLEYVACAEIIARRLLALPAAEQAELVGQAQHAHTWHATGPLAVLQRGLENVRALLGQVQQLRRKRYAVPGRRTLVKASLKERLEEAGVVLDKACDRLANAVVAVVATKVDQTSLQQACAEKKERAAGMEEDEVHLPSEESMAAAAEALKQRVATRQLMIDTLQQSFSRRSNQTTQLLEALSALRGHLGILETRMPKQREQFKVLLKDLSDTVTMMRKSAQSATLCAGRLAPGGSPPAAARGSPQVSWHGKLGEQVVAITSCHMKAQGLIAKILGFDSAGTPAPHFDVENDLSEEFADIGNAFAQMRALVDEMPHDEEDENANAERGESKAGSSTSSSSSARKTPHGIPDTPARSGMIDFDQTSPASTSPGVTSGAVPVEAQTVEQLLESLGERPAFPDVDSLRAAVARCQRSAADAATAWQELDLARVLDAYTTWCLKLTRAAQGLVWPRCTRDYAEAIQQLSGILRDGITETRLDVGHVSLQTSERAFEDIISVAAHVSMLMDGIRVRLAQFLRIVQGEMWSAVSVQSLAARASGDPTVLVKLWETLDDMNARLAYLRKAADEQTIRQLDDACSCDSSVIGEDFDLASMLSVDDTPWEGEVDFECAEVEIDGDTVEVVTGVSVAVGSAVRSAAGL